MSIGWFYPGSQLAGLYLFACIILSSRSAKVDKEVKKRGGGFTKLSSLSPELQKFTGASELARTEVLHYNQIVFMPS